VLLIDEIDKSDIDLPNDLLHIFEEGEFEIPELARLPKDQSTVRILSHDAPPAADPQRDGIPIERGWVRCREFPLVVMTSNGEREFPPAFLRRCLHLKIDPPDRDKLVKILRGHLAVDEADLGRIDGLIGDFLERRSARKEDLAADQLLNAVYLALNNIDPERRFPDREALVEALWHPLNK
jgi:MoxR-like ATPase